MKNLLKQTKYDTSLFKLDLKMKISALLLFTCILTLQANDGYSQKTKVTIDLEQVTVEKLIDVIEEKTEYRFLYLIEDVDLKRIISIKARRERVNSILDRIFNDTNTGYIIDDRQISLTKRTIPDDQNSVSGTVLDNLGTPLPGVSVVVKGTQKGAVTDFDGAYSIVADAGNILIFSYIGFSVREVTVLNESTINVTLEENTSELDEVVVVGYQTQRKREISGAISQVKSDVIERQAVANFAEALQGQVAGVTVQAQSGAPGARINVQIRGTNSLTSTGTAGLDPLGGQINPSDNALNPLFIVDGVPFPEPPSISPNEIESIEVLKDAASTAIYGVRAGNGVIIITTKRAKEGPLRVEFNTYTSINRITSSVPTLTTAEYIGLNIQVIENNGQSFASNGIFVNNPNALDNDTDWQDIILKKSAITKNYNARLSGGSENANFSVVLDHFDQDGLFINSDFKRTNLRLNNNFKKGKFSLFTSVFLSRDDSNSEPFGLLYDAIVSPATEAGPERVEPGNAVSGDPDQFNILGNILRKLEETSTKRSNTSSISLQFKYELLDGLNARVNLSGSKNDSQSTFFRPGFRFLDEDTGEIVNGRENDAISELTEQTSLFEQGTIEGIVDYKKEFGKHNLTLLGGISAEQRTFNTTRTDVREFRANDPIPTIDQAIDRENISVQGNVSPNNLFSVLGSVGYDYDGRYLIKANVRRDGTSNFEPDFRFRTFFGASAAWSVAREEFFKNSEALSFINDLKFRASYGEVGNQNIGAFRTSRLINNNLNVPLGDVIVNGLNQTQIFNQNLQWETSITTNFGIDISLFDSAFTLTGEYYDVQKENLLLNLPLPFSAGAVVPDGQNAATIASNVGELTNTGIEITVGYKDRKGDFRWGVNGTYTQNENEITQLFGSSSQITGPRVTPGNNRLPDTPVNFARLGFQAGAFFLVPTDGLIRTQEELDEYQANFTGIADGAQIGDARLVDVNGDGTIDLTNDRRFFGNNAPDFEVGLNFDVAYKNFDFSMSWFGSFGSKIFNGPRALAFDASNHRDQLFAYTPTNPTSDIPIIREGTDNFFAFTDIFLENGDYARLRNIQLGYNLPKQTLSRLGFSKFRIYIAGSNVLTITDYSGFDPEVGGDGLFSRGLDRGLTPITGSGRLGLQIGF